MFGVYQGRGKGKRGMIRRGAGRFPFFCVLRLPVSYLIPILDTLTSTTVR